MCQQYVIVYSACKANSESQHQRPWCKPEMSQVREYVNCDGWRLCGRHDNEEPCRYTPENPVVYTFLELYCSNACEKFVTGTIAQPNPDIPKDRLAYVPTVDGSPCIIATGNLLVDLERVRLIYKALIDFVFMVYEDDNFQMPDDNSHIGFPLTASFPAHAVALFLQTWNTMTSEACSDIHEFNDLDVQHKVQILQRLMAAMSITENDLPTLSVQEKLDLQMNVEANRSHDWNTYRDQIRPGDLSLPAQMPGLIDQWDEQVLPIIQYLVLELSDFETSEDDDGSDECSDLWMLGLEYKKLEENIREVTTRGSLRSSSSNAHVRRTRIDNPAFGVLPRNEDDVDLSSTTS